MILTDGLTGLKNLAPPPLELLSKKHEQPPDCKGINWELTKWASAKTFTIAQTICTATHPHTHNPLKRNRCWWLIDSATVRFVNAH